MKKDKLFSTDVDPVRLVHQLLCAQDDVIASLNTHSMFSICISGPKVFYMIDGTHKLNVAHCSACNMDGECFMTIIKSGPAYPH